MARLVGWFLPASRINRYLAMELEGFRRRCRYRSHRSPPASPDRGIGGAGDRRMAPLGRRRRSGADPAGVAGVTVRA